MIQGKIFLTCSLIGVATIAFFSFAAQDDHHGIVISTSEKRMMVADSLQSIEAFQKVYTVLMSPRCMNCHPAGEAPLQGDDSHAHEMGVTRGSDGKGVYAMKCSNCHQAENTPGVHTPPGNPNWHLPPADMKMVFEGRNAGQLAKQLLDPKENGGKTIPQLIEHISHDSLVLGGWNPGEGRTLPPLSHAEFEQAFKEWIDKGAVTNF